MTIATRRPSSFGALLSLLTLFAAGVFTAAASAQATTPSTPVEVFLGHIDLAISGAGEFTSSSSGQNYLAQNVSLIPSNTLGALVELRYTRSPRIGAQFNYGFARYTNNYTVSNTSASPKNATPLSLGAQAQAAEVTLGYVGHLPDVLGLHLFVGAGGGVLAFRPTRGGGDSLPGESRGVAYYAVGLEQPLYGENFGVRVQFRQMFYGAPDFNTNYLADGQRSSSSQPTAGLYLRF